MRSVWVLAAVALCVAAVSARADDSGYNVNADGLVFDEALAIHSAWLAAAAYCSQDVLLGGPSNGCGEYCEHASTVVGMQTFAAPSTNAFGWVGVDNSRHMIVVSVRGTMPTSMRNWLDNLEAVHVQPYTDMPEVSLHDGFFSAYASIKQQLLASLKPLLSAHPSYPVLFTGHSLGGAVASIAAFDIMVRGDMADRVKVITFGSPRVGNLAFSTYFSDALPDSWRVTHSNDMVPHVPTEVMGYTHVASETWFYKPLDKTMTEVPPGSYTVCTGGPEPAGSEDPSCSDSISSVSIEQHFEYMGIYISGCDK